LRCDTAYIKLPTALAKTDNFFTRTVRALRLKEERERERGSSFLCVSRFHQSSQYSFISLRTFRERERTSERKSARNNEDHHTTQKTGLSHRSLFLSLSLSLFPYLSLPLSPYPILPLALIPLIALLIQWINLEDVLS
jgi:hypothetical protein